MKTFYQSGIFCLFILFSVSLSGNAQNEALHFEHIGLEEGLSNETVMAILQDRKGYIWMGTDGGGLNKYDSYSFTKYQFDPLDSNSLSQNIVYTIWEDQYGSIWIGTTEGLCKFDRSTEKFTRYKPDPNAKFSDPNISAINEDSDGMMWVAGISSGLCRFDRKTGVFLPERFDLNGVNCIYKDRAGVLWIGNPTGLHRLNLSAKKAGKLSEVTFKTYQPDPGNPNSLSSNKVTSVFEDRHGIIWVATGSGLNSFDRSTEKFTRYQNDPKNIHSISSNNFAGLFGNTIKEDQQGNLWIATDSGLNKLNPDRTSFTSYYHNPNDVYSLSTNIVSSLHIDESGILYAGCWQGKLNKVNLNPKPFGLNRHDQDNINSLSNNEVTAILEDAAGIIWIGTYGGGLNRWDRKTNQFTHFRHNRSNAKTLKSDTILALLADRHGHLWVCNGDVLSQLNNQTGEFTHYYSNVEKYKDRHRFIFSVDEDHEGFLWLGTGNGVKRFDKKKGEFVHYYYDPADTDGISDYTARAVFADSRDNIWVGYGSRATDKFIKQTSRFIHYKHDPKDSTSISSNGVNSFFEDAKGNLWLGTSSGGLCSFDHQSGKFRTFTDKRGLPDNTVYSILTDNKNHLWLGTDKGLSRFDPVTKNFTNYDYKDGLQSNKFAAGGGGDLDRGAAFKGRDGTLYFGGNNGFNFFDPLKIKADSTIAPIVITQFKLFDKLIKGANELKEIVLDYDQNYFSFEFSSLSFYSPSKNQYAYKLEGFDKDWVNSGSRRYAAYTYVDPGEYTFKVKGTNNDGVWNETGTYIIIKISPPWWHTWWAYTGYALLAVGMLAGARRAIIQRERLKSNLKLEQIEREKEHIKLEKAQEVDKAKTAFFTNISHEFRTPLTLIKGPTQNLLEEFSNRPKVREQLEGIQHNADLLLKLINQLLDLAKLETGNLRINNTDGDLTSFLDVIVHSFASTASYKGIDLIIKLPHIRYHACFDKDKLEVIVINLIGNALKFTPAHGQVGFSANIEKNISPSDLRLIITVSDNGIGIPAEQQTKIFERFYQVDHGGAHTELGTGIGLALVKELTELMGGQVTLKSEPAKGSEFHIVVPLQIIKVLEQIENLPHPEKTVVLPLDGFTIAVENDEAPEKPKILVVEDNADLRKFIIVSLGDDYDFLEADNGKLGLEVALMEIPELIVSDLMMPEMDGLTMTAKIKKDFRTSHVPIIVLTAKATEEDKLTSLNTGADDYLTKPFNKSELVIKVRNAITSRVKIREKIRLELLTEAPKLEAVSGDEKFLVKVKEVILNRLSDEQLSVDSLAVEVGWSRAQFYRKITALTGKSVNDLIQGFRLQKAAQLLQQQWGSVSQVAYEVGFSNPSYFSKCFKEHYGVLPSEYPLNTV